jgi:CHAT domain-containing protein
MPFAQLESALIRHLLQSTPTAAITHRSRAAATRSQVLTDLHQPHASLHFTGHAAYCARQPEASALALTPDPSSDDPISRDGLLTTHAIAQLDLASYRLIGLATCETALTGNTHITTEYVGLASAFLKAGAANVLSTLWPVDEISSCWFMVRFYQALLAGASPAIALQTTQQWLRRVTWADLADWIRKLSQQPGLDTGLIDLLQARAKNILKEGSTMGLDQPTQYQHPYYWAAFTLTGQG